MKRQTYKREDGYTPADLFAYAKGHLSAAKLLFDSGFPFFDSAGHLGHLAIELLLKALLLHRVGSFPPSLSLCEIGSLVERAYPGFRFTAAGQQRLQLLTRFNWMRYPTPKHPIDIGTKDRDLILELAYAIAESFPEELSQWLADTDRGCIVKGGRVLMVRERDG